MTGRQLSNVPLGDEELPSLYSFDQHRERFGDLSPAGQLTAFLALPQWQQAEAWLDLSLQVDGARDPNLEAAA